MVLDNCLKDLQNKIMDITKQASTRSIVFTGATITLTKAGLRECNMRRFLLRKLVVELSRIDLEEPLETKTRRLLAASIEDAEDMLKTSIEFKVDE